MKKVAIFTGLDIRVYGGGETYAINLANELINSGNFCAEIFSPVGKRTHFRNSLENIKKLTAVGISFFSAPEIPILQERFPLTISGLKTMSKMRNYDVIYNEDPSLMTNFMLLIVSKIYKKRMIFALHNPYYLRSTPLKGSALRKIGLSIYRFFMYSVLMSIPNIHTINYYDRQTLIGMGYNKNIYEIPNWVTIEQNQNNKSVSKDFVVLSVGRLQIYQKGIDFLCKIIESAVRKNPSIKFHIVGSGDDGRQEISKVARKYRKNVVATGFLSEEKLKCEYSNASLYIMTSRFEGHPVALLEAQSCGLPAVAFAVKGVTDIIANKEQGSLVKQFDIEQFSDEICTYYKAWKKRKILYNAKKKNIVKIIKSRYGREIIIPKILKMFDS